MRRKYLKPLCALAAVTQMVSPMHNLLAYGAENTANTVFINEIESNDADGGKDWVEIINTGTVSVDISGWLIVDDKGMERVPQKDQAETPSNADKTGEFARPLPEGTILQPGEVLVLEEGTDFAFGLGKKDQVTLYDSKLNKMDEYSWTSHAKGTYARVPDGIGKFVDQEPTKGAVNVPKQEGGSTKSTAVINEINSAPDDWVEIMNVGSEDLDISGYEIRDNSDDHRFKLPEGTILSAKELFLVEADTAGLVYDKKTKTYAEGQFDEAIGIGSGDSIRLYNKDGKLLDQHSWTSHASYNGDQAAASLGRYPDGTGSFVLMPETPGKTNSWYAPQVVINEVESNDDVTDWVEIYNAGTTAVDISGWYLYDNDPTGHQNDITPVKEGTILQPGAYYVFDQNEHFTFGLGKEDEVTIYSKEGIKIAEYAWKEHAAGVFARIPDGTGELVDTAVSTKGKANSTETPGQNPPIDNGVTKIKWPGSDEVRVYDTEPMFLEDSSGLDFHDGQLYAVDNGTGKFWILNVAKDGSLSFAKGFENGKTVNFASHVSAKGPDTEGITVDGDGFVYLASERDNSQKGVNYNVILKVDPMEEGTELKAIKEWDLTASLPQVSANTGIEAVEWVSNEDVEGKLFDKNTGKLFDAANYPDASADGLFFVALEDNGHVYAYVLNEDGSFVLIADIDSKIGGAMALDYDTYEHVLWVAADDGFGNIAAKLTFTGEEQPELVHVTPPAGVDIKRNNEGFAIADAEYTVNGQRPVYRFMDGVKSGALTIGSIDCDYMEKPNSSDSDSSNSGSSSSGSSSSDKKEHSTKSVKTGTVSASEQEIGSWIQNEIG